MRLPWKRRRRCCYTGARSRESRGRKEVPCLLCLVADSTRPNEPPRKAPGTHRARDCEPAPRAREGRWGSAPRRRAPRPCSKPLQKPQRHSRHQGIRFVGQARWSPSPENQDPQSSSLGPGMPMASSGFPAGGNRSAFGLQNAGRPLRDRGSRIPWGLDALEDPPGPKPSHDHVWGQRRGLPPPPSSCGPVTETFQNESGS